MIVNLRSDLVPGVEVDELVVTLDGVERERRALAPDEALLAGVVATELAGVVAGSHRIVVSLLRQSERVATQPTAVTIDAATSVTVVITRDCRGVDCGSGETARACLGARCVEPSCTPETPALCPEPDCTSDDACPSGDACSTVTCQNGVCLYGDAGTCVLGDYCDAQLGCLPRGGEGEPFDMLVSVSADRSSPRSLEGAMLEGEVYIFPLDTPGLRSVEYRIDRILEENPHELQWDAPFDLVGEGSPEAARPLNLSLFGDGDHVLAVIGRYTDDSRAEFEVSFRTRNGLDGWFYSRDPFRGSPLPLAGASVTPPYYAFFAPGGRSALDRVRFYLDDTAMMGAPYQEEQVAPYDLAGAPSTEAFSAARQFRTADMSLADPGPHEVSARLFFSAGGEETVNAAYTVLP